MTDVMTPLDLSENDACLQIVQVVTSAYSPAKPGTVEAAILAVLKEVEARIFQRQRSRTLMFDPFTRCAYAECANEGLGAFCPAHAALLPLPARCGLASAIVAADHDAYGVALKLAREEITERLAAAANA